MKYVTYLIMFFLLTTFVFAINFEEGEVVADKIDAFVGGAEGNIVIGKYASKTEKLGINYFRKKFPEMNKFPIVDEDDYISDGTMIILIGGPYQNNIASQLLADTSYEKTDDILPIGVVSYLTRDSEKVLILSDNIGYKNFPKTSLSKSPLAKFMPEEFIPAAATAIGLSFIALWNFLFTLGRKIATKYSASKALKYVKKLKKDEVNPHFKGFRILGIRFKVREWISISAAAITFALITAYAYFTSNFVFVILLGVTVGVNLVVYAARHIIRLVLDRKYKIHTEYRFWIYGGIMTVLTGWLGNTFSLAGYVIKQNEKKSKAGLISLYVNLMSFFVAFVFYIINELYPNEVYQMITVLSLALGFIQMLPIEPFSGRGIYRWSKLAWWLAFIPMATFYTWVNLIV